MRRYLSITLILALSAVLSTPAWPQTSGTNLVLGAKWDDGTAVAGTITYGQVNTTGPDTVIATKTLSNGWASVSTPLVANTFYDVTLVTSDGTQLVKFPITTAIINPANLQRGEIDLVFRKINKSLQSAKIRVSLEF